MVCSGLRFGGYDWGGFCRGAAEMLDGTIRGSRDLAGVIDRHLIVTIPVPFYAGRAISKSP